MQKFFAPFALFSLALAVAICPQSAFGQSSTRPQPRVVTTCGTPPYTYTAGNYEWQLQDQNGNTCTSASFSASITVAPLTSTNAAGSIAVTNTFQSIQVSTAGRNGCLIQNQSTANPMWVYFGAIGGATKAKSYILDTSHGLAIACAVGGIGVVTDQISITGTSGDLYNANLQ